MSLSRPQAAERRTRLADIVPEQNYGKIIILESKLAFSVNLLYEVQTRISGDLDSPMPLPAPVYTQLWHKEFYFINSMLPRKPHKLTSRDLVRYLPIYI